MNVLINLFNSVLLLSFPLFCWNPLYQIDLFTTQFDFIIVGAGSAGAVVASRLSANPNVKVLLLEAGGCPPLTSAIPAAGSTMWGTDVDWQLKTAPQNNSFLSYANQQANYPQGKMLGGGSSLGDMWYFRGNEYDYDNWKSMGNDGWGWADVLPYFQMAEGGPLTVGTAPYSTPSLQAFLQSAAENGYPVIDVNSGTETGSTQNPLTENSGIRESTFVAYLQPAKNNPNLAIVTNAEVTKIILNNNQTSGVQFVMNGKSYSVSAGKEVILSAGAIGSPKLLMLSGIGPASQLQQLNIPVSVNLPGVGGNLQDHVGCGALLWKVNCSDCTYSIQDAMSIRSIFQWLLFRTGPVTISFGSEGNAFIKTKFANNSYPDVQLSYVSANVPSEIALNAKLLGISQDDLQSYFGNWANEKTFSIYPFVLRPKSRGSLRLQSNNYTQPPIIDFAYLTNPNDIQLLIEGVKTAIAFAKSTALQAYGAQLNPAVYPGCEGVTINSDEYWECVIRHYTLAVYHPVGTCKMGPASDVTAVVNSKLQVHKIGGLRVADASIMPQIVSGNTEAAVVMIAEKASAVIKTLYNI